MAFPWQSREQIIPRGQRCHKSLEIEEAAVSTGSASAASILAKVISSSWYFGLASHFESDNRHGMQTATFISGGLKTPGYTKEYVARGPGCRRRCRGPAPKGKIEKIFILSRRKEEK